MFSLGEFVPMFLLVLLSLIKIQHAAEDITINECLYTWNITEQAFSCYVAWTGDPPSNDYTLNVKYNTAFVIFNRMITGVTTHNFTVNPTIDEGSAEVQVVNFETEKCILNLVVPDPDPIETIHILNYTIINTTDTMQTLAFVRDLHINWTAPVSPTGDINNHTYEIRIADNETIPDSATVLPVTVITTSMDQQYQTGSVSMTNSVVVPDTFTVLYFQIRSSYNITLGRNSVFTEYTMISNWSTSQPLLRFPPEDPPAGTSSSIIPTTTAAIIASTTTSIPLSLSQPITTTTPPHAPLTTTSTSNALITSSTIITTNSKADNIPITTTNTNNDNSNPLPSATSSLPSQSSVIIMITTSSRVLYTMSSIGMMVSSLTETNNATNVVTGAKTNEGSILYIIVGAAIAAVLVVIIIVVIVTCVVFHNKRRKTVPVHHEEIILDNIVAVNVDRWEVPHECVVRDKGIGSGAFGEVYKAVLKGHTSKQLDMYLQRNNHNYSVAVKTLKATATESDHEQFLKEIELMKRISENSNPHVVNMIGASTVSPPLLLILEYVQHGDLLSYLISCRHESLRGTSVLPRSAGLDLFESSDVPSFAYQIASGMEYLSSMGLVHRDLASRNILVGEERKLKITDFGLSRQLNLETMYVAQPGGRFPVRWMAIESIMDRRFTTSSDVWSFGVTLWEIGSLGETPYSTVGNDDLLMHIKNGHRLQRPADYINEEIYSLMKKCWSVRPSERPTFTQLRSSFDSMLVRSRSGSQFYMDLNHPFRLESLSVNQANTLSRPNPYVKVS